MTLDAEPAARVVLIDGSGYIFRAFFRLPPMTRGDGTPTNAVYGFSTMIFKLMQERPDDDLIVIFDAGRTSFRNEIYADYKANRDDPPPELVPQFPLIRDAARAFGLPVVEVEGFEADDIIATYVKTARGQNRQVEIVSSDKDLMQLIDDGVSIWDPMKEQEVGADQVMERFGVGPARIRDLLALAGDTSDNVPGVPSIGPKTAAQLIADYGSLEGLLANLDKIKQPKRRQVLTDNVDQARLSFDLVGLRDDVDLPVSLEEATRRRFDDAKLMAFLKENSFTSMIKRLQTVADLIDGEPVPSTTEEIYETITSLEALDAVIATARAVGYLAIDTETTALNIAKARLVGISLACDESRGFYLPLGHVDDFGEAVGGQLDLEAVAERLGPLLIDPAVLKIGHNLKYDISVLVRHGLSLAPIEDTLLLSYVLDGARHGHGMDELAKRHLDHDTISYESICGSGRKQITFDRVPIEKATDYAAEDALVTLRLWQILKPRLAQEKMATVYETLERPLSPLLARMERRGIRVDAEHLRTLSVDFTGRMGELETKAYKLAGRTFNLGSPKQLGEILYDEMGIGGSRKTKTGAYATGADVLEGLAASGHELPQTLLDWRQMQKLTRTYTDALIEDINPQTKRIHTSYAMASTSTGRLSSNEPNLQNIPIRTEEGRKIRAAFVPDSGYVLVSADYSQIELRVLAHMADIQALKRAFADDIDIHAVTAAQMFKKNVENIGPELRRSAKTINYGIIYGIGAFGLAQRLGIAQADAKAYIEAYFEQYPGIKGYMDRTKAEAHERGFVQTLFGRRCYIPDIGAKVPHRRGYAERQAINAPIQGSAADIMKRAMVRVGRMLDRELPEVRMLLQVHDELVFEVPNDQIEQATVRIRQTMQDAAQLSVPLIVDVGHGKTWDAAH